MYLCIHHTNGTNFIFGPLDAFLLVYSQVEVSVPLLPVPRAGNDTDVRPILSTSFRHLDIPPFHTVLLFISNTSR